MPRGKFKERCLCPQKAPRGHVHLAFGIMYTGTPFRGLQVQTHDPTHHTIEGVLIQAMKDIGIVAALERGRPADPQHHLARACRTDRGVHAIRNLISIFVTDAAFAAAGETEGICAKMNAQLPAAVRVARVTRVMGNFVPRNCCTRRVYRYLIPAYALLAPCDTWQTMLSRYPTSVATMARCLARAHDRHGVPCVDLSDTLTTTQTTSDELDDDAWWVALRASVARCNELLREFVVGGHRFHNFSVDAEGESGVPCTSAKRVHAESDEAARVVYRCEVAPRLLLLPRLPHGVTYHDYVESDTTSLTVAEDAESGAKATANTQCDVTLTHLPFVVFQIEGSSFLFNMIRKIVGTLLAICRGARVGLFAEALSPERLVRTPLAPGPYLLLAFSSYFGYDAMVRARQGHTRLTTLAAEWSGAVATRFENFATETIYRDIVDVDCNVVPGLDQLLAVRDVLQHARRPCSAEEDSHLVHMKEYKPRPAAGVAPRAACSEMTRFLRLLRVHNWAVKSVSLAADSKAMLELKNKRLRAERSAGSDLPVVGGVTSNEDNNALPESDTALVVQSSAGEVKAAVETDDDEDGWMYVAATPEAEARLRRAYHQQRQSLRKRSREWQSDDRRANDVQEENTGE